MKKFYMKDWYHKKLAISIYQQFDRVVFQISFDWSMKPNLFSICFLFWSLEISYSKHNLKKGGPKMAVDSMIKKVFDLPKILN